ncbi:hypothetical protein SISSUDRAFT_1038411 [Sistotremastrum suecicum HHB10207 ss-3]|uniref:F-box domain-containing protein n=1 Tax=Sistotremastrum suecicum HHB10207 ss-3 TaxID=1314776 RepID=A0A165WS99_9AGAM|nr:hypothetical protein SISSUDRAFT_1038411 [Sistotremastrum suecicum HHB10207 ss-3]
MTTTSLGKWNTLAAELVTMIYEEMVADCCNKADVQSWKWMVLLHICSQWRSAGFSSPKLWDILPSVVPPSIEKVFLNRCLSCPTAPREMWIMTEHEHKQMSKVVADNVQTVHISMWRRPSPDVAWYKTLIAPTTNILPKLKHVVLHAGPFIEPTDPSYHFTGRRTVYYSPPVDVSHIQTLSTRSEEEQLFGVTSLSFTFFPGRNEPFVYYPSIVHDWLGQWTFNEMENLTLTNMGRSGSLSREPLLYERYKVTMPKLTHISFVNCDQRAVERFMRQSVFPALKETLWNGKNYDIRVKDGTFVFQCLS